MCNSFCVNQLSVKKDSILNLSIYQVFKEEDDISKININTEKLTLTYLKNSSLIYNFNSSSILLAPSNKGFLLIGKLINQQISWKQRVDQILKKTYNQVGEDYFESITKTLSLTFGMKYTFIAGSENLKSTDPIASIIKFWDGSNSKRYFKYRLEDSPSEHVVNGKQLIIKDNLRELFPNDQIINELGINSYIGTPVFYKDGSPLGILVMMDTEPINISEKEGENLHVFANRVGIEMEWVQNDKKLKSEEGKLRATLKSIPNPVYVQDEKGIYKECNDAFLNFLNLKEEQFIDQALDKLPKVFINNKILSAPSNKFEGINRKECTIEINANDKKECIIILSPITDNLEKRTGTVGVIQDISEMKEAEKILKIKEEKYRTLFNKASDAFLLMSNDTIIDCNPRALEMFGCSKDTLIGSSPQLFSPKTQPDNQDSGTKALEKINKAIGGESITFYWKHKKYNDELFDAEVSLSAFNIKDELLIQAIVRDVSENIKASKAIEKQTHRMKKLYELSSDTTTTFNQKLTSILELTTKSLGMQLGGVTKVDGNDYVLLEKFSQIGISLEDITYLSNTYCSISIEENKLISIPNFSKSGYAHKKGFKLMQFESYIGVPYWVKGELRGAIWFTSFYSVEEFNSLDLDFVQSIAQWMGYSREREEYEENLKNNKALLETLLREIPIDFSVRNKNLDTVLQSNKSKEIWGDNEGKPVVYNYDTGAKTSDKWKSFFNRGLAGEIIKQEDKVKIFGKSFHLYSILSPIWIGNKVEQLAIINIDISQLKKAEKKLKSQNTKLKKLNTELDRFVYSASHDLRAPLASLLGLIDLSQREQLTPVLKQYLTLMNTSIKKLDSFISDITDYSRNLRLAPKSEKIDFKEFINDIYQGLAFMNPHQMDFNLKVLGRDAYYSDPDRLKLILSNLISNSIRYRSLNHKLVLRIEVKKLKDSVEIIVEDNGLGIQEEYQTKVFEMFYRASDQNTGSGLGLFIVKETMDKLKGKLTMKSKVNKGTCFILNLPNSIV